MSAAHSWLWPVALFWFLFSSLRQDSGAPKPQVSPILSLACVKSVTFIHQIRHHGSLLTCSK